MHPTDRNFDFLLSNRLIILNISGMRILANRLSKGFDMKLLHPLNASFDPSFESVYMRENTASLAIS